MDAADVLEKLVSLGVSVTPTERNTLWLEPASAIPPDLVEEVRRHKLAIIAHLRQEPDTQLADSYTVKDSRGLANTLRRLHKGMEWLTEVDKRLRAIQDRDKRLVARFLEALDLWDNLDKMVRELYHFEGCVLGPGQRCPDDAPVACRYCGSRNRPHWIEGGQLDG